MSFAPTALDCRVGLLPPRSDIVGVIARLRKSRGNPPPERRL
ncbi:MAG: hypothetical protein ACO211_13820 [bacterium]